MNTNLINHSLLPTHAVPLDARSHFKDFYVANNIVMNNVCAAEDASEQENETKRFYTNQIITTTENGTWQVTNTSNTVMIYFRYRGLDDFDVSWGKGNVSSKIPFYLEETGQLTYRLRTSKNGNVLIETIQIDNYPNEWHYTTLENVWLIPFSGSGGGVVPNDGKLTIEVEDVSTTVFTANQSSSTTLTLSKVASTGDYADLINKPNVRADSGLQIDSNNNLGVKLSSNSGLSKNNEGLSLSLGSNSGLSINNGSLSLSVDSNSGLTLDANGLSLSVDNNTLKINENNKLYASGVHKTVDSSFDTDTLDENSYIYLNIGG